MESVIIKVAIKVGSCFHFYYLTVTFDLARDLHYGFLQTIFLRSPMREQAARLRRIATESLPSQQ